MAEVNSETHVLESETDLLEVTSAATGGDRIDDVAATEGDRIGDVAATGGDMIGNVGVENGDSSVRPKRTIKATDRGKAYQIDTKRKAITSLIAAWHRTFNAANNAVTDETDVETLREARNRLEHDLTAVTDLFHEISPMLEANDSAILQPKIGDMEQRTLDLLSSLTQAIRGIQLETRSQRSNSSSLSYVSKRSGKSNASHASRASRSSKARAEAAAESAALKAKLKHIEKEAELRKNLEVHQAKVAT